MDNIHPFLPGGPSRLHCPPLSELFDDGTAVAAASFAPPVNVSDMNTTMTFFRSNKFPLPAPPAAMYDARDATNGSAENIASDEQIANAWWDSDMPKTTLRTPERKLTFRRPAPSALAATAGGVSSSSISSPSHAPTVPPGQGAQLPHVGEGGTHGLGPAPQGLSAEGAHAAWEGAASVGSDDSFLGEFGVYSELVHGGQAWEASQGEEGEGEEEGHAAAGGQDQYMNVLPVTQEEGEGQMEGVEGSQAPPSSSSSSASSASSVRRRGGAGAAAMGGTGAGGRVHMLDISSRLSLEATRAVLGVSGSVSLLPSPTQPVGGAGPGHGQAHASSSSSSSCAYWQSSSQAGGCALASSDSQVGGGGSSSLDESMTGGGVGGEGLPSAVKTVLEGAEGGEEGAGSLGGPAAPATSTTAAAAAVDADVGVPVHTGTGAGTGARLGPVARTLYLEMEQDREEEEARVAVHASPPPCVPGQPSSSSSAPAPALWHTLAYQPSPWPSSATGTSSGQGAAAAAAWGGRIGGGGGMVGAYGWALTPAVEDGGGSTRTPTAHHHPHTAAAWAAGMGSLATVQGQPAFMNSAAHGGAKPQVAGQAGMRKQHPGMQAEHAHHAGGDMQVEGTPVNTTALAQLL